MKCTGLCLIVLLFSWQTLARADNDITNNYCTTPDGLAGQCVPVTECASILTIIQTFRESLPAEKLDYLRSSSCGISDEKQHICCALNSNGLAALAKNRCGTFDGNRVAFGVKAPIKTFRWMALLRYNDMGSPFKCGGSLISERYVLTAAHCVNPQEPYEVRLGERTISTDPDCDIKRCADPVQDIAIEAIIAHPSYNRNKIYNDIALIRLSRVVVMPRNGHITTICLPINEELMTVVPDDLIVAGWGRTENSTASDDLMFARIPNRSLDVCETAFRRYRITKDQLCVGGKADKTDSCKGDSGAPLGYTAKYSSRYDYRMVQFGVVSFGVASCGMQTLPAVYTNVARYMLWITDNIKE